MPSSSGAHRQVAVFLDAVGGLPGGQARPWKSVYATVSPRNLNKCVNPTWRPGHASRATLDEELHQHFVILNTVDDDLA